jgi:electron transport complex protein RnfC
MGRVWPFHGGVHPPENKLQSNQSVIVSMPVPQQLVLPLNQHIGAPAKCLLEVGTKVLKGQLIASAQGFVSANLHAPSSGTITVIDERTLPHPSALVGPCIVIDTDGQDQWIDHAGIDPLSVDQGELLQRIRSAGITGMGGAGFPSAVKLQAKTKINTLIINAAECEPYITADDRLIREYSEQIIAGVQIIRQLLDQPACIIGIEDNKTEAIAILSQALTGIDGIEVGVIPTKYPSGGEKQLIQILTGQQVPHGSIPADLGLVCHNVGTAKAIADAILLGQPLISRVTTVTGKAAAKAGNYQVLIGTQVSDLIAFAEVDLATTSRLVMGGPMMGFTLTDHQVSVIKSTNCILASSELELAPVADHHACIRCGQCEVVCPAELLPQQLFWFAKAEEFDKAQSHNLTDCIECGACAWVCPSQIPLVQYYRFAKGRVKTLHAETQLAEHARLRFETREQRLIDEKLAKEEKRKARAVAAAAAQAAKRAANPDAEDPIAAALARVNQQKQASATCVTAEPPEDAYKALKTAAAITRTKLKKSSKALTDALASGHEQAESLQTTVDQLALKANAAKAALSAYETKLGLDPEHEKQLQLAAAQAGAVVRKLEKSLATAEDAAAIEAQIVIANTAHATANQALEAYQHKSTALQQQTQEP